MDLQNLKEHHGELLSYMENKGYSKRYIQNFKWEINRILKRADHNNWSSYADIYQDYLEYPYSEKHLKTRRVIIGALEQFDVYGVMPGEHPRHFLVDKCSYAQLTAEFKELVDFYCSHEQNRGKKESTILHELQNISFFLLKMQETGARCLDEIQEKDVLSYFVTDDGRLLRGYSCKTKIAAVFKVCLKWKGAPCRRILNCLPALHSSRKNIQYLTEDEIRTVKKTMDRDDVSLRNKAIIQILLFTGLRRSDIAGLTFDSIDWQAEKLLVCQQKTGVSLELPLTASVGNAIYEYVTAERPDIPDDHLFLSEKFPFTPLSGCGIASIVEKVFRTAGIRMEPGDRKGTHIFRHNLASALLENGVSQPVISQMLGHTAPESLEPYLKADFVHLKECAISVEAFPLAKEVFLV